MRPALAHSSPCDTVPLMTTMDQAQYERLLRFRTGLRRFLRWSAEQAAGAGLTPAQHQLLLAIRGHPDPLGPTIGDVARYLFLRHHSTVELIDRAQTAGLLERRTDPDDSRVVRLRLTERGDERLQTLTDAHMEAATIVAEAKREADRIRNVGRVVAERSVVEARALLERAAEEVDRLRSDLAERRRQFIQRFPGIQQSVLTFLQDVEVMLDSIGDGSVFEGDSEEIVDEEPTAT